MARSPGGGGGSQYPTYSSAVSGGYYYDNLLHTAQFLMSNGYSRTAAAGIAGAIAGESAGDPEALQSGGTGAGLIQWTPGSKARPDYPIVTGNTQADFNAQLTDILYYNETSGPVRQLKTLRGNPVSAADFYSQQFERPAVTNSDVRASVANTVYADLKGYKPDSAYTQFPGTGGGGGGGKSGKSGGGVDLGQYVSDLWNSLFVGAGEQSKIEQDLAQSGISDTAQAIIGLTAPFAAIAHAIDWFFIPSHWVRIGCLVGGSAFTLMGIVTMTRTGRGYSVQVPMGGTGNIPSSLPAPGGQLAPALGIAEVTIGAVLLFFAFHNLPPHVETFSGFVSHLQEQIQQGRNEAA